MRRLRRSQKTIKKKLQKETKGVWEVRKLDGNTHFTLFCNLFLYPTILKIFHGFQLFHKPLAKMMFLVLSHNEPKTNFGILNIEDHYNNEANS